MSFRAKRGILGVQVEGLSPGMPRIPSTAPLRGFARNDSCAIHWRETVADEQRADGPTHGAGAENRDVHTKVYVRGTSGRQFASLDATMYRIDSR